MNFRTVCKAGVMGLLSVAATMARADIPLKDTSEIAGTWKLESVAAALDKPRIEENRTWEFRPDGKIVTSGYNRHFKTEDRHEWTYKIVNGKIAADDPGRPGKTIDYSVYKKEGNELILKGGIEGFYFFKKQ
jgi:hypothetical protein